MASPSLAAAHAPRDAGVVQLTPVAPSERIEGLDMLRGWAMLGVLLSNLNDWYWVTDPVTRADKMVSFAQEWLVESRFYSLLAILFGVGFAIQLTRAEQRGVDLRNTYLRRSAALLGIGLVHALLIWHGDVLISYALASFFLLLFRNRTPRQQLAWGILFSCAGAYIGNHIHFAFGQIYRVPENWWGGSPVTYATGTLTAIQVQRFRDVWHWWGYFGLTVVPGVVGSFLLGAWALRSGLVARVVANRTTTLRFIAACAVFAVIGYTNTIYHWDAKLWPPPQGPFPGLLTWAGWNPRNVILAVFNQTARASGLLYAGVLLLALQTSRGKALLAPLAATGRMALTTYLTQSIVCTTLFYSYGLGWFGTVSFTGMLEITITLFGLQMLFSTWYLRRFRYGPAEWVWRTLTYGRAPDMSPASSTSGNDVSLPAEAPMVSAREGG